MYRCVYIYRYTYHNTSNYIGSLCNLFRTFLQLKSTSPCASVIPLDSLRGARARPLGTSIPGATSLGTACARSQGQDRGAQRERSPLEMATWRCKGLVKRCEGMMIHDDWWFMGWWLMMIDDVCDDLSGVLMFSIVVFSSGRATLWFVSRNYGVYQAWEW